MSSYSTSYNPDVLSTLANLSSDEVFTPPHIANQMLDLLPQELFQNKNTTFLDPATKSGVFLREITKRLIKGLENDIPDLQERIDHILHNQVFGIATTELTSLISRRSLYCSKFPNSRYSISHFNNKSGGISFEGYQHTWKGNRCQYCGADKETYNRNSTKETYAYQFIHQENNNMKFDVIIGNPPYQISDGGAKASARPLYHLFITTAKKLNPRFICMITPSRWFSGGKGLDDFRRDNITDNRYKIIFDFVDSKDCFPGVEIKGGVNYFLWDREYSGPCEITNVIPGFKDVSYSRYLNSISEDIFVRYNSAVSILNKVRDDIVVSVGSIVSTQKPFGLRTFVNPEKVKHENSIILYGNSYKGFISKDEISKGFNHIDMFKIFISRSYGAGEGFPHQIINKPFVGEPGSACTETYLMIGPFKDEASTKIFISYIKTKFFRFLVMLRKITQDTSKDTYNFVPFLELEKEINDQDLYSRYKLTKSEIDFIEKTIKPMDELND